VQRGDPDGRHRSSRPASRAALALALDDKARATRIALAARAAADRAAERLAEIRAAWCAARSAAVNAREHGVSPSRRRDRLRS
jgi:hypothetical protein